MLSTVLARYVLIVAAGLLQLGIAIIIGMTAPAHPFALAIVFSLVAFSFIGIGLVIAALADSVPAVQALGQCVFLPMLILGGVAVPIASLPAWAQHLSAFLPGKYAVESLQRTINGPGFASARFDLLALAFIGAAALFAGTKLFRWAAGQHFRSVPGKPWLIPAFAAWVLVGFFAESRGRISADTDATKTHETPTETTPVVATPPPMQPWEKLTDAEIDALDFRVPPDAGRVTPFARENETPDEETDLTLARLEGALPHWPAGQVADPIQRARNLLSVAAVVDLLQIPLERFAPPLVQQRLLANHPEEKLVRMLAWIALHPNEGTVITDLSELNLEGVVSETVVRERIRIYAIKMIARVSGRQTLRQ